MDFYLQDQLITHNGPLHEKQLLNILDNLCCFILHEVVHVHRYFFHPEHELATEKKNMKAFTSGTLSTSVPAPVASIRGNRTKSFILSAL